MFRGLKVVMLFVALGAFVLAPALSVEAKVKPNGQFNEKFTFTGVTFNNPDGTVTENGVIEAGSKQTGGGSTFTTCSYYSEGYSEFLGTFQSDDFASSDPEEVRAFCLAHAAERT